MKNCIKLSLLVLVFLILVDLIVLCDGQTTVFNETGTKAYGLKVQFNKPVTITRAGKNFDSYLSMDKNTILFSDGVVEPWADFFFFWKPKEAEILSYKWLSKSELPVNRSSKEGSSELILGGQIQYYLAHKNWDDHWKEVNPLKVLHENGMDWIQVRLTTTSIDELRNTNPEEWDDLPDEDWWEYFHGGSLEYVEQILKEASSIGMKLNLGFYLSHEGAHSSVQKTPPKWKGLELNELISTVHDYCFQTTEYFKERGLNIEIYNVGNEIQEGILGYLPGQKIPIPDHVDDPLANISYMRSKVWKVEARLLKAAIRGIKESDNDAKITIHVSGSSGKELINPFFQTMVSEGVEFDYAGITFPGVERDWPVRFKDDPFGWIKPIIDHLQTLNKKVIFSEFTYPNDPSGIGGVPLPVPDLPKWKTHVSAPGYPLTPSGQAKWVRDFLSFCRREENVAGAFYYYPEFFPGICEEQVKCYPPDEGFGLFSSDQKARLALSQFKENPERFPDVILLDEKDNSVKWSGSWESDWDDSHVGKTRKGSGHEGSKVTVNFSGTGITLIHDTGPSHGIADVVIDGVCYPSIDMYSPEYVPRITNVITTNLPPTNHKLTITVSGNKNKSSSGDFVIVDAFEVIRREPLDSTEKLEFSSDEKEPQLISFSFSPKSVDISSDSETMINAKFNDDVSGVSHAEVEFVNTSNREEVVKTKLCLSEGIPDDGTYTGSIFFPESTGEGNWEIKRVWAEDRAKPISNSNHWDTDMLRDMGFPTELEIISEPVLEVCSDNCKYDSIQHAIQDADIGDTVKVGPGSYSTNLTIDKFVVLRGSGPDQTVVKGKESSAPIIFAENSGLEKAIKIEDIKLSSARGEDGNGISASGTANFALSNVVIANNEVNGIEVSDKASVVIQNSIFRENGFCGIEFYGKPRGKIINSIVTSNDGHGIAIQENAKVDITESKVSNNYLDGIYLNEYAKAQIKNSELSKNRGCGINASSGNNIITCIDNSILDNKGGNLCGKAKTDCK